MYAVTMRTKDYRYIQWQKDLGGELMFQELYDHRVDPDEKKTIWLNRIRKSLAAFQTPGTNSSPPKLIEETLAVFLIREDPPTHSAENFQLCWKQLPLSYHQ